MSDQIDAADRVELRELLFLLWADVDGRDADAVQPALPALPRTPTTSHAGV